MRRTFAVALILALSLPAWLVVDFRAGRAGGEIVALEFQVQTVEGRIVHLHFSVRAANDAEAREAAALALGGFLPGARPVAPPPADVTAQHAPWGWRWADAELPVPVAYNPDGAVRGVGPDAIAGAMETWNGVPTSRFAFRYAGFTDRPPSLHETGLDGESTVAWVRMDCALGCVLGVTARDDLVHEADVILNQNPQAGLGDGTNGTVDTRTVLTHELGHVAGLEHSCPDVSRCTKAQEDAVMYYRYPGVRRALREDDIAGISELYPRSSPGFPALPVLPEEPEPVPAIDVSLRTGWNLLVLPSGPVESFMGALPCAEAVYGWSPPGWATWVRSVAPGFRPMSTSEAGRAYWVFADAECAATFR
jgi:hypothetical protein